VLDMGINEICGGEGTLIGCCGLSIGGHLSVGFLEDCDGGTVVARVVVVVVVDVVVLVVDEEVDDVLEVVEGLFSLQNPGCPSQNPATLHTIVDSPINSYPCSHVYSADVPNMVLLAESLRKLLAIIGGFGHKTGSHLGGGPFHLSSTSQVSCPLPTST
jgi:hypothetical protein